MFFSSPNCQTPIFNQSDSSLQWQVRPAKLEDVAGVTEILADSFHSQDGVFGWAYPLLRLGIYEDIRSRLCSTAPYHICLVAVDVPAKATTEVGSYATTDKLTGTVELVVRSIAPGISRPICRSPYLSNLAVHPHYRRQGVAKHLLLSCERIALSWGFHDLYLGVLENNHQARQLYFKLGYQLHRVDNSWSAWLLRQPRQLLLHKRLDTAVIP